MDIQDVKRAISKYSRKVVVPLLTSAMVLLAGNEVDAKRTVVNPNANDHVVFYIPHQDDEALTFGVSIMNHIKAGYQVHVVLLTDGSASFVRKRLDMTPAEFTEARNAEFALSLKALGVKASNVEYKGYKDSELTVAQVEKVIKSYEAKYPNANHKTFSYTDKDNHDHSNAGIALKNVQKAKITDDARYYVRRGDNPKGIRLISEKYYTEYNNKAKAVSKAYSVVDEDKGLHGIGRKSVKKSFEAFDEQPLSRYHK